MDPTVDPIVVLMVGEPAGDGGSMATGLERADDRLDVHHVPDTSTALSRLGSREYDCIVAADTLPSTDGIDFLETVREREADLPFVLCAEEGSEALAAAAIAAGVTDYVVSGSGVDHAALAERVVDAAKSYRADVYADRRRERLERFVAVVSHDLRSPLNVAQGRLELARGDCESDHLDPAANAVDRSLALIDDLLTLASEGEAVTDPEPIDLRELVEACGETIEPNDATLVVETERRIRGDPSRVRQLFENLLGNAVRHGGDGVTVRVGTMQPMYTSTRADDERPMGVYVADDGPGIPPDERERAFETGFTTAGDGTGFGLDIAREIARAHGWDIRAVESRDGGARFEVTGVDLDG